MDVKKETFRIMLSRLACCAFLLYHLTTKFSPFSLLTYDGDDNDSNNKNYFTLAVMQFPFTKENHE